MGTSAKTFRLTDGLGRIVVLGGGLLACDVVRFGRKHGIEFFVFSGPRQRQQRLADGRTNEQLWRDEGVEVRFVETIDGLSGGPYELARADALVFSFGSPFIIKKGLIDLYGGRVLNCHNAPLPEWRGGGGYSWRIMAGDRRGNTCFHLVTPGIDDGDIVYQKPYRFPKSCRKPSEWQAHATVEARKGLGVLLDRLRNGRAIKRERQVEARSTYLPRLDTETQAVIDWAVPGDQIERLILAFSTPYAGAFTWVRDDKVRILDANFRPGRTEYPDYFSGLILRIDQGLIHAFCRGGTLEIPCDAVRSSKTPKIGDRFWSPRASIDDAMMFRPVYTPTGLKTRRPDRAN